MNDRMVKYARSPWFPLPASWRAHAIQTPNTILLETAGGEDADHHSYLFHSPRSIVTASSLAELRDMFDVLESSAAAGLYAAGSLDYEAGYALHDLPFRCCNRPLASFGIYGAPHRFDHRSGELSASPASLTAEKPQLWTAPLITPPLCHLGPSEHASKVADIQALLAAGDTYQVNFTTRVSAELLGPPLALYEALVDAQPVDFAAIVHIGNDLTFSFSPELFFRMDELGYILTRPMKGTAPRGGTPLEDADRRSWLSKDEKNRAEHVMIVDLLRNDLGRICEIGSICTEDLFHVEAHPTVLQMTSSIRGKVAEGISLAKLFSALFPSGSITGAPKRRTMEIINELEAEARGVYTGAIGFISPSGGACFNVPIRTLDVEETRINMGVGGGIVADSMPGAEYEECLLKAEFLSAATAPVQLIETLLWNDGYPLLNRHLNRLAESAQALGFRYDRVRTVASLSEASKALRGEARVRLLLSADGRCSVEAGAIGGPRGAVRVRLSARRLDSGDPWLCHKTTHRRFYDRELARACADGFDEAIFLNERGEVAEGTISNVFAQRGSQLYTPPLTAGVLPGVLRSKLLAEGAEERTLRLEDLQSADIIYVGNALRGLRAVSSLELE